jgi:DNA-binding transcriptional regulator YiaG
MSNDMQNAARILPEFVVDNLGASFKVILVNSAKCNYDTDLETEYVDIPDYDGLMNAVATLRAIHERKLSGLDIKFLRKHLGLRSKDMAAHLDVSPEHLSRCENNEKVLSSNSEKLLRLMVLMKPFQILQKIVESSAQDDPRIIKSLIGYGKLITDLISKMKIISVSNDSDPLIFKFEFKKHLLPPEMEPANDDFDDGEWHNPRLPIAA